jgi:hypothetical protein
MADPNPDDGDKSLCADLAWGAGIGFLVLLGLVVLGVAAFIIWR